MKTYKLKKGLISDKLGQKLKIFDSEESVFHTFNNTATLIFNQIKHGHDEKTIIKTLMDRYKIEAKQAKSDLSAFIKDLKLKGIIE